MKLLVISVLLTLLTAPSYASRATTAYGMWLEACTWTQYSCFGIEPPIVVYERMSANLYGYYDGGDTIYVNSTERSGQRRATIFHETVHYLQVQVGGLRVPGPAREVCMAEEEAFAETDEFWIRHGKPQYIRGERWWEHYEYCKRWYDPDWPMPIWEREALWD